MFRPPTKYSEYLQDVRKSIDYILKRVNSKYVSQIVAGSNVTISPADGTGVVTINAAASGGGVTQIVAGTNVTISPIGGTGVVTINATGGGGGLATPTGYGSFYSNVTQTLAAINTPQAVTLGSTFEASRYVYLWEQDIPRQRWYLSVLLHCTGFKSRKLSRVR
jgi:hypothetical protein